MEQAGAEGGSQAPATGEAGPGRWGEGLRGAEAGQGQSPTLIRAPLAKLLCLLGPSLTPSWPISSWGAPVTWPGVPDCLARTAHRKWGGGGQVGWGTWPLFLGSRPSDQVGLCLPSGPLGLFADSPVMGSSPLHSPHNLGCPSQLESSPNRVVWLGNSSHGPGHVLRPCQDLLTGSATEAGGRQSLGLCGSPGSEARLQPPGSLRG